MATETLRPNGELSDSGLVANDYTDHDEDPDVSSVTINATGNNTSTEYGADFPTPSGDPTVGVGLQEFRVGVEEFDSGQSGTPTARIELWENGSLVRAGSNTNVSTYAVLNFTWNANELSTADGSLVQLKVIGTKTGGSPGTRNTVRIGHIEWNADYAEPAIVVTPSPASAVSGKAEPTVVLGSLSLSPTNSSAVSNRVDPVAVLGSLSITSNPASSVSGRVDPTVTIINPSVSITPSPASSVAGNNGPTAVLGSQSITPSQASAVSGEFDPVFIAGNLNLTSVQASAVAAKVDPTVTITNPSVSVTPSAAVSVAANVDPVVVHGPIILIPDTASVVAGKLDPVVMLGGLSIVVSPVTVVGGKVDPAVIQGSLSYSPTAAFAIGSKFDPTILIASPNLPGSMNLSDPGPSVSLTSSGGSATLESLP